MEIKFIEKPKHRNFKDIQGQRFSRLVVIGYGGRLLVGNNPISFWWCQCDCGNTKKIQLTSLRNGTTKSCGCFHVEATIERSKTHGKSKSSEYNSFRNILKRCNNPNNDSYAHYGGRGIKCLYSSFEEFFGDVGEKPLPKNEYSIERINNNGHYEKGNCIWATTSIQHRNERRTRKIQLNSKVQCLKDWSEESEVKYSTVHRRIKNGWCVNCSLIILPNKGRCKHK